MRAETKSDERAQRLHVFPFTALQGLEAVQEALSLVLVNRRVGPLLITGPSGTGKSVAVRSVVAFGQGAQLHNIPLSASEDRIFGSMDMEAAIKEGKRKLNPGILSEAAGNLVYVDDANLMAPNLLREVLKAVERSYIQLEREGLSARMNLDTNLVATMNPDEGLLDGGLLDLFGLIVETKTMDAPADRVALAKTLLAWDRDSEAFLSDQGQALTAFGERIASARANLSSVAVPDAILTLCAALCEDVRAIGHRGELYLVEAARAFAALEGRAFVRPDDVERAAAYVLPHRMRQNAGQEDQEEDRPQDRQPEQNPEDRPEDEPDNQDNEQDKDQDNNQDNREDELDDGQDKGPDDELQDDRDEDRYGQQDNQEDLDNQDESRDESERDSSDTPPRGPQDEGFQPDRPDDGPDQSGVAGERSAEQIIQQIQLPKLVVQDSKRRKARQGRGKRSLTRSSTRLGRYVRAERPKGDLTDVAFDATLRAAAPYQKVRDHKGLALAIEDCDLRQKMRETRIGNSFVFLVDASGSMAARKRMNFVRSVIMALLQDAYEHRDRVSLITFRRQSAEVLLPFTNSVDLATKCLQTMPTGGKTPLGEGLYQALNLIAGQNRREAEMEPILVLVTDGRANSTKTGGDPVEEALSQAEIVQAEGIRALVIDTEQGFVKVGMAPKIAAAMGASYYTMERLSEERFIQILEQVR